MRPAINVKTILMRIRIIAPCQGSAARPPMPVMASRITLATRSSTTVTKMPRAPATKPTVSVSAAYAGANAETVQNSVIVPLEEAINGVENMMYMTSSANNNGSANIQIYFRQGTNADMAMVNVQNRIASAQGLLPAEVTRSGVSVKKNN